MPDINLSSLSGQQRTYNAGTTANRPTNPVAGELFYDTTLGGLMVYNGSSWSTFLTPASVLAPTNPVATNQGSGRAYNNGQASISFTPSSELGGSAALYTVTSTPGSLTATGTSSPIVLTGLQSNTSYTFTVTASNSYSNATSAATSSITATTVPDAPVLGTATDSQSGGIVSIPITSQNTGGSAITNYSYSTDGVNYIALSPAQTTSPITISGLTNNQAYTFRLKAINVNGSSQASSVTNSVTPTAPFVLAQTFNSSGNYTIPAGTTRVAIYTFGGGQSGIQDGAGGSGGSGAGMIINSPSIGTTYAITVGAGGTGNGGGAGGVSSFGTLINSTGTGNGSGIVAGNGGGTGGSAGTTNFNANIPATSGQSGNAGGNVVLTNATGFGSGLPNALQYGGGGGGGGGGNGAWQTGAAGGGAGGSPFGGAGGSGGGAYDNNGEVANNNASPGASGQTPSGGGGGSGRRGNGGPANSGAGGGGRVLVYTRA